MAEENGDPHEERVEKAFDSLHETLGERLDDESRGALEKVRDAAKERDRTSLEDQLHRMKGSESWLYRELAQHPDVAALINELAVWGF